MNQLSLTWAQELLVPVVMVIFGNIFTQSNHLKLLGLTQLIIFLFQMSGKPIQLMLPLEITHTSGQLKIIKIRNRGVGLGTANLTYVGVPIKGDGTDVLKPLLLSIMTLRLRRSLFLMVVMDTLTELLTLLKLEFPWFNRKNAFDVIIPPNGGHGARHLQRTWALQVLFYVRFENDIENPDFITGNEFARIGICENPIEQGTSTLLTKDKASAVYTEAVGTGYSEGPFLQTLSLHKQLVLLQLG